MNSLSSLRLFDSAAIDPERVVDLANPPIWPSRSIACRTVDTAQKLVFIPFQILFVCVGATVVIVHQVLSTVMYAYASSVAVVYGDDSKWSMIIGTARVR